MREQVAAHVAIGANLGDAAQAVRDAVQRLGRLPRTRLVRASSLYRTGPVEAAGPDFINAVAEIATGLSAPELLAHLQAMESDAGRERLYRNAPRTLDLDLLRYGSGRIESAALTVPHPRMMQRAFVLVPLAEIAPHLVTQEQLAAVAGQRVTRMPLVSEDGQPDAGDAKERKGRRKEKS